MAEENRPMREKKGGFQYMKKFDVIAAALVIVGALNWGLAGVFHVDLVAALFGMRFGETSALSAVVYGLVGIAGLYQALSWKSKVGASPSGLMNGGVMADKAHVTQADIAASNGVIHVIDTVIGPE
jgi:uncharacterized membrane protein YuzA (DUF378 family)